MKDVKRKLTIEIDGKDYPCYQTMGALMLLERETGKSADKCTTLSDQCIFLWACCKSASRREGIDFPYTIEDFADNITPEDLATWAAQEEERVKRKEESDGEPKKA